MARSKKDGAARGGHRRGAEIPKWRRHRDVRRERHNVEFRRDSLLAGPSQADLKADRDLERDYAMANVDWEQDYHDWRKQDEDYWNGGYHDDDLDPDPYDMYGSYDDGWDRSWGDESWIGEENYGIDSELFLAIERVVRRHGLDKAYAQAYFIATMFDTTAEEVQRCLRLTSAGYIRC